MLVTVPMSGIMIVEVTEAQKMSHSSQKFLTKIYNWNWKSRSVIESVRVRNNVKIKLKKISRVLSGIVFHYELEKNILFTSNIEIPSSSERLSSKVE
jgi:hypothetical protein